METREYEAALRIDHEAVKAYALQQRGNAIDATWKRVVSTVAGLVDGLRLDKPAASARLSHLRQPHHRSG